MRDETKEHNFIELIRTELKNAMAIEYNIGDKDPEVVLEDMYMSDEDIHDSYSDYNIRQLNFDTDTTGFLDIEFPNSEDKCDNFIIYMIENRPHLSGKIGFTHWYPERITKELIRYIYDNMINQSESEVKTAVGRQYGFLEPDPDAILEKMIYNQDKYEILQCNFNEFPDVEDKTWYIDGSIILLDNETNTKTFINFKLHKRNGFEGSNNTTYRKGQIDFESNFDLLKDIKPAYQSSVQLLIIRSICESVKHLELKQAIKDVYGDVYEPDPESTLENYIILESYEQLMDEIKKVLTPDLLKGMWKNDNPNNPLAGHCYAATEALYWILGGTRK